MRPIEFRQFIFHHFHYWGYLGDGSFVGPANILIPSQQFTSYLDKNEKKIWEGDIVEWLGWEVKMARQIRPIRQFVVTWDFHELARLINIINNGSVEVVGNIYENPELLEVK